MVFKNSGHIVYLMFATVAVVACLVLVMQVFGIRLFPQILKIPYHYMYPALLIISMVSAYVDSGSLYKCGMMLAFAVVGIFMAYAGMPTVKGIPVYRKRCNLLYKTDFLHHDGDRHRMCIFSDHPYHLCKNKESKFIIG